MFTLPTSKFLQILDLPCHAGDYFIPPVTDTSFSLEGSIVRNPGIRVWAGITLKSQGRGPGGLFNVCKDRTDFWSVFLAPDAYSLPRCSRNQSHCRRLTLVLLDCCKISKDTSDYLHYWTTPHDCRRRITLAALGSLHGLWITLLWCEESDRKL